MNNNTTTEQPDSAKLEIAKYDVAMRHYEYEQQRVVVWFNVAYYLSMVFYIVCLPTIYFFVTSNPQMSWTMKVLAIMLLIFSPFLLLYVEQYAAIGWNFLIATITGTAYIPTTN
jgi:hypothetical protein